jgi:hypothetical protein
MVILSYDSFVKEKDGSIFWRYRILKQSLGKLIILTFDLFGGEKDVGFTFL